MRYNIAKIRAQDIMRYIILLFIMLVCSHAAVTTYKIWEKGKTFSEYLAEQDIPSSLLDRISDEDQKFLSEIRSNYYFFEQKDKYGRLLQALIPISTEMQIHLFRKKNNEYGFDVIPVAYRNREYKANVEISNNLHSDIIKTIHLNTVADKMGQMLKGVVNAKQFKKGDRVYFLYEQKTRLGIPYTMPHIKVAMIRSGGKEQFIYTDEDGYGYTSSRSSQAYTVTKQKKIVYTRRITREDNSNKFTMPLRHARITSHFAYRRWHPILHRYRPHHGTDFGARRGTPLLAVNDGRVSYAGWMRGYGKVVKIRHSGGYESLYAHQSRIRVKLGERVKKGEVIGYVGSTGRSTGPHLHFGLMKYGRWIDPMKVLRKKSTGRTSILKKFTKYKNIKTTKYKTVVIKDAKLSKAALKRYIHSKAKSDIWDSRRLLKVPVKALH